MGGAAGRQRARPPPNRGAAPGRSKSYKKAHRAQDPPPRTGRPGKGGPRTMRSWSSWCLDPITFAPAEVWCVSEFPREDLPPRFGGYSLPPPTSTPLPSWWRQAILAGAVVSTRSRIGAKYETPDVTAMIGQPSPCMSGATRPRVCVASENIFGLATASRQENRPLVVAGAGPARHATRSSRLGGRGR